MWFPGEDRGQAQKRFRAGELDIVTDIASEQIDWLRENLAEETRIAPYLGIYYYPINTEKEPFTDKRVRQALSMAINREALTDKVLRTGELPAYSFVPPGTGNYGEPAYVSWKDMAYGERVAQTKSLMQEAGYGPDNPLTVTLRYNTSENHKKIAIAVAAMWKQIFVKTELFNAEVKVHYNDLQQGDFEIARAGWIADYDDPQNFLYLLQTSTGPMNYGNYSQAEFDGLMEQASKTVDLEQRAKILAQAEAVAMEDQPIIPIYYYVSKQIVGNHVKNWIDNAADRHPTRWLRIER